MKKLIMALVLVASCSSFASFASEEKKDPCAGKTGQELADCQAKHKEAAPAH